MTAHKPSRNNMNILDLHAAGTIVNVAVAPEQTTVAGPDAITIHDNAKADQTPAHPEPLPAIDVSSESKEAKPGSDQLRNSPDSSDWQTMQQDPDWSSDFAAAMTEADEPSDKPQKPDQVQNLISEESSANGDTLFFKTDLEEEASAKGNGIKPGFELPGGPTLSIDESNLHLLMNQLDWGQWDGQVWDEWSGMEVTVLTYRYPQAASQVADLAPSEWNVTYTNVWGQTVENFNPFTDLQIGAAEEAMDRWAEASNVRFLAVGPDQEADISFFGQNMDLTGLGFATGQSTGVNESFLRLNSNRDEWNLMDPGEGGYFTLMHEIGHSLGLFHPGDYDGDPDNPPTYMDDAEYIQDTQMYTVMSYFEEEHTGGEWGTRDSYGYDWASPATLRTHDMYVIQQKYGVNWDAFVGDTVFGYNSTAYKPYSQVKIDAYNFDKNEFPIITIWDGGGFDTLDLSGDDSDLLIDLNPGAFSSTHGMKHNISIAYVPEEVKAGHNAWIEAAIGGAGNDRLIGNYANNYLQGGAGDDRLEGDDGNDELNGGNGYDKLLGGTGEDTLNGGWGWDELDGGSGDDELHGGRGNDLLGGGKGDDDLFGGLDDDELFGGDGDDYLVGGEGNDILNGGAGNDSLNGSEGFDTADYSYATSNLEIDLSAVVENLDEGQVWGWATRNGTTYEGVYNIEHVISGSGDDIVRGSSLGNNLDGGDGNDKLFGRAGRDGLSGGDGDDELSGGYGRDVLNGGGGNDRLVGGEGQDTLMGGKGVDTADYRYSSADRTVSVTFGTATDGAQDNDIIYDVENVVMGEGDDTVRGSSTSNLLDGGAGHDNLTGLAGNDVLLGVSGNDVLNGGVGSDLLSGGSGIDTADYSDETQGVLVDLVITTQQDTIGSGLDTLGGIENLEGSQHDDWLLGNDVRNVIEGGLGDDSLFGRGGDDVLWGNDGDDILLGGLGDDGLLGGDGTDTASYLFATGGVRVNLSTYGIQNTYSAGEDLLASIENLSGSFYSDLLTGDKYGNRIDGLDGNDALSGMDGDDVVLGGKGNDTLSGGAGNDVLEGGSGIDWAVYTDAVVVNLDQETQNTFGAGIDTLRDIENLSGSIHGDALGGDNGRNELKGNGGDDWLFGRAGNDTLRGGAGDDMIAGNAGSDALFGGSGNDTFIFEDGWGNDTIHDFVAREDVLDFGLVSGLDGTFDFHISESDGSAVIGYGLTNSVKLNGVSMAELDTSDWIV